MNAQIAKPFLNQNMEIVVSFAVMELWNVLLFRWELKAVVKSCSIIINQQLKKETARYGSILKVGKALKTYQNRIRLLA